VQLHLEGPLPSVKPFPVVFAFFAQSEWSERVKVSDGRLSAPIYMFETA
jgi:hypothetical protein